MFTYDFIPNVASGKNKIVRFKSSKRNKQNGGQLNQAEFGMQQGGQQDEVMQIIQMFAQMSQMDPAKLMQQLQQMPPEQQQQAIQQMAETLQQGGGQQPDMQQAAMMYGGYTTGMFAEGGEPNGGMALGQMSAVADKMSKLRQFVSPEQNLDPWIASKLAIMDDSAAAISDYMMYNPEAQGGEEMMEQEEMPEMGNGGYTVTRSSDRKGKTHKVTGPDGTVKYFGDSKLGQHPNDPERKAAFYARHKKNLAGNPYFRAFARKTWEEGGQLDYAQVGVTYYDKPNLNKPYDPYSAKQAQSDQYANMMNQYNQSKSMNSSNMYSGLEGAFQQNAMMNYSDMMMKDFEKKRNLKNMNTFAPSYTMDAGTGKITIKEPDYKTDEYARGGYVDNMYYAQGGGEMPRQEDFPDYNSFAAALQDWQASGEYQEYYNPPAAMADSLPIAQPVMGVPPVQNAVASQPALNPYEGVSVYDFLSAQNKSPDYASRKVLAGQLGIKNYTGRADQNKQIIDMIKQNPNVLQSYAPSAGSKSSPKTTTVIDQQGNPVQVPVDSTTASRDTTSVKPPVVIPKKRANESEDGYIGKVIGILGSLATVGGLTYLESQAMVNSIAKGAYDLSGPSKAKLTKAIKSLRTQAGKTATEGIKGVSDWFNSLPVEQKNILNNLDAAEIPGTLANTRPGTAAKSLETLKMLQETAAEATILNDAETVNALSEAEAERKALRSFNGQKAAAIRWGKPVPTAPKFPSLGGAPAAAKEGNAFMNALREAQLVGKETPWIKNTLRFMRSMPKFQEGGEPDSMGENILEWIDPTGISSWDDVRRSWNDTNPEKPWYQTPLEIAGAIPVFGKFGKGAKAANAGAKAVSKIAKGAKKVEALSTGAKVLQGAKKVGRGTLTGLDWVGGSAPQRLIDNSINPFTRMAGSLTEKALANSPKLSYVARGIQPFQQGQRFWKGVGDVTGQGLGTINVPAPELQEIRLISPDGKVINTNSGDPKVLELMNKGMIDTTAANYNTTAGGWNLKPGAKYKGGGSTFSGNAWYKDGGTNNPGFRALPDYVQSQILSNMAYGGIQLDPAKKGTFKAQATRMGMGVQQAASSILNAPEGKYSPAMRKKANFAKNFAKQEGGQILDVTPEELETLRQQGYQFEIM